MNNDYKIRRIKETYRPGTRIRLVYMADIQAPPKGTEGTVFGVDAIGSVLVNWDNGSCLNVIPSVDQVEFVEGRR